MKKTVLALGVVLLALSFATCEIPPEGNSITVRVAGCPEFQNGKIIAAVLAAPPSSFPPPSSDILGTSIPALDYDIGLTGTTVSLLRQNASPYIAAFQGTTGVTYYVAVGINKDGSPYVPQESGDYYLHSGYVSVTADGPQTIDLTLADFDLIP
jgi:hypothetical protein